MEECDYKGKKDFNSLSLWIDGVNNAAAPKHLMRYVDSKEY